MDTLYDEERLREVPIEGSVHGVNMFYLHVRLLKAVAEVRETGGRTDHHPVYLVLETRTSYEGDPDVVDFRGPYEQVTKRTYSTGPDSLRIRHCIAIADKFGGKHTSGSH